MRRVRQNKICLLFIPLFCKQSDRNEAEGYLEFKDLL